MGPEGHRTLRSKDFARMSQKLMSPQTLPYPGWLESGLSVCEDGLDD